jgi:4-amino-4-deoxy-L-arabinose transferase-like glycosyltransferase
MPKRTIKLGNKSIAVILACVTAIILTTTEPAIGLTWDEPAYISSSESYMDWFTALFKNPRVAFQAATIDPYWTATHEHPPLDRIWSGMVWSLTRPITNDLMAHRLGNILLVALMVGVLYFMVADVYGKPAGLFAAGALMSMPRFFFHSHLAALDMPVAVAIFFVTFLFWRTIDRKEWWWGLVLGLAWGLAEAVKLNATFLPIGLVVWFLIFRRTWYVVFRFFLMGIVAILTFVLVWPWLYHQTWTRILEYINFHLHHFDIGTWYFGHYYVPPPWPYVFVILWAVVPLTVMLLAFIGIARAGRGTQDKGLGWLLLINALVPLLIFAVGRTLVYDGERLLMPTFPFLAALAGAGFGCILVGLRKLADRIKRPTLVVPASIFLAALLLAPQVIAMIGLYPHWLSYYSEGVGGLPGATKMGLETTYWCESYAAALPYINAHANPGDLIWVEPWSYDVMIYYQLHGLLRPDVKILNNAPGSQSIFGSSAPQPVYGEYFNADWIILEYRQTQFDQMGGAVPHLPDYLKTLKPPVLQISYQGIPIMELYKR